MLVILYVYSMVEYVFEAVRGKIYIYLIRSIVRCTVYIFSDFNPSKHT